MKRQVISWKMICLALTCASSFAQQAFAQASETTGPTPVEIAGVLGAITGGAIGFYFLFRRLRKK